MGAPARMEGMLSQIVEGPMTTGPDGTTEGGTGGVVELGAELEVGGTIVHRVVAIPRYHRGMHALRFGTVVAHVHPLETQEPSSNPIRWETMLGIYAIRLLR
jgi:hypothetical protein